MTRIPATGVEAASPSRRENDLGSVDLDQFLQLLITELQNQDPMNPLDNSEMVQQLGQIREIGATNLLTETLTTLHDGQTLSTASTLIGKEVSALADDGQEVRGIVDRVTVAPDQGEDGRRTLLIHIGQQSVQLNNIREIIGDGQASG